MTSNTETTALDFLVSKSDLHQCKSVPAAVTGETALQPGQVLLKVDQFAFTSNNVTYAAFGDAMSYWNFFPAEEGWGRIPVWGFGDVIRSEQEGIAPGERFYGYFPMSSYLVVEPERIGASGFHDGAAHRKPLHPLYNQYLRTSADPSYQKNSEAEQMLFRPLLLTSFLIDDFLFDNGFFGADAVILSSASSKTSYGLAFMLARRAGKTYQVIGLTSPGNVEFVKKLGCYDQVLTYDQATSLPADTPVVYVDMAGNGEVRSTLHHHFGDNMKYSCAVGGTHWEQRSGAGNLPGARPTLFFAPAQAKKRAADWGPHGVQERFADVWQAFLAEAQGWMKVTRQSGPDAVEQVYRDMIEGRARPDEGHVLSL